MVLHTVTLHSKVNTRGKIISHSYSSDQLPHLHLVTWLSYQQNYMTNDQFQAMWLGHA